MEIGQKCQKNHRDPWRLAVTQSLVKDHQLTLMSNTRYNRNNISSRQEDQTLLFFARNKNIVSEWGLSFQKITVKRKAKKNKKKKNTKKLYKYQDLVEEMRNILSIKLTVIPIIVGALGRILTNLEKRRGNGYACSDGDRLEISMNTENILQNRENLLLFVIHVLETVSN